MKYKIQNRINDYVKQLKKDTINKKLTWRPVFDPHVVFGVKYKGVVLETTTNTGHRVFLYETIDNTPTLEIPKTTAFTTGLTYSSLSITGTEVTDLYLDVIMPITSPDKRIAPVTSSPSKLQILIGIAIVLSWFAFLIFIIRSQV